MTRPSVATLAALCFVSFLPVEAATAAEIAVISANGLRDVLVDVTPAFERTSGHKLTTTITETGEIKQRIVGGARYLRGPETTAAIRTHCLEPG